MNGIKEFIQGLRRKGILIKLVLSYTGTAILSVLIVAILLSNWFSRENAKDLNNLSQLTLSNFCLSISNVFESSEKAAYDIYKTPYFRKLTSPDEVDKEDLLDSLSYINNILVSNANIYSIIICNDHSIVLDVGSKYEFVEDFTIISNLIRRSPVLKPVLRTIRNNNGDALELYSFLYNEPASESGLSPSVIINLKAQTLNERVFSKLLNSSQDIVVAGIAGTILMNRDTSMLGKDISQETYFRKAIELDDEWGQFVSDYHGNSSVINYYAFGNGKYLAFMISDYNEFFLRTSELRYTIAIVCVLVFLAILFLSMYISRSLYSPINNIFNNVRSLVDSRTSEKTSDRGSDIRYISSSIASLIERLNGLEQDRLSDHDTARSSFILSVFSSDKQMTGESFMEGLRKYEFVKNFDSPHVLMVFRIGKHKAFISENTPSSIEFQLGSSENIALQILSPVRECSSCRVDADTFILIASVPELQAGNHARVVLELSNLAREMQETIHRLFKLEVTIGISEPVHRLSLLEMRDRYLQAFNLTNYRLVYGRLSVFTNNDMEYSDVKSEKTKACIASIVDSVKASSLAEYRSRVGILFHLIRNSRYEQIIAVFFRLAEAIRQVSFHLANVSSSMDLPNPDSLYGTLRGFDDYEDLEAWFIDLFNRTTQAMLKIRNTKKLDQIGNVSDYIKQNYHVPDLSASMMAERLGISPQYFSRIFKDRLGCSFPDYINDIRMEKAKELLLSDKQYTISEICEKVGYRNKPYFTNSFTKKYGVSPTKLRQTNRDGTGN